MGSLPEPAIRFRIAYLENGIRILAAQNLDVAQRLFSSLAELRPQATPLGIHQQGEDSLTHASDYVAKLDPDRLAALLNQIKSSYNHRD